jgi:hypothetical protein
MQHTTRCWPSLWSDIALPDLAQERTCPLLAPVLHVAIAPDASFKVGTCEHCVLAEQGRPARAWDADGDAALDFDRERYFTLLAQLGLVLHERQAYVCP